MEKAPGRKRNVDRAGGALGFGVKRLESGNSTRKAKLPYASRSHMEFDCPIVFCTLSVPS